MTLQFMVTGGGESSSPSSIRAQVLRSATIADVKASLFPEAWESGRSIVFLTMGRMLPDTYRVCDLSMLSENSSIQVLIRAPGQGTPSNPHANSAAAPHAARALGTSTASSAAVKASSTQVHPASSSSASSSAPSSASSLSSLSQQSVPPSSASSSVGLSHAPAVLPNSSNYNNANQSSVRPANGSAIPPAGSGSNYPNASSVGGIGNASSHHSGFHRPHSDGNLSVRISATAVFTILVGSLFGILWGLWVSAHHLFSRMSTLLLIVTTTAFLYVLIVVSLGPSSSPSSHSSSAALPRRPQGVAGQPPQAFTFVHSPPPAYDVR